MSLAVIDLGTNTFHLLIVKPGRNGSWKKVFKERVTVKLGQGGMDKKIITRSAYHRGILAIEQFRKSLDENNVKRVYAFGTAALRTAVNGHLFLKETKDKYGINIKLISGDEEAVLIYEGVKKAVSLGNEKSLIMDIGGGSLEFVIANNSKIFWKKSYPLGAALLLSKFKPSDPVSTSDLQKIRSFISGQLESLIEAVSKHKPLQIVGSAGSFETFASMIRHRNPNSGSHYGKTEHSISISDFNSLYRDLIKSDKRKRRKMKGLVSMRIDMIVVAAVLLKFVLLKTKISKIKLSAYALKEGALLSILNSK
jgi:exopolyphosphatase / guanosine-5'-triphosphate,3'-diphosphate pyrophosphatase